MSAETAAWLTIFMMALAIYGTRVAGVELMALFPMTPRLEAFLKSMALSVLVAIVTTALARGGLRESAAVLAAAIVIMISKSAFAAISAGLLVAAAISWFAG